MRTGAVVMALLMVTTTISGCIHLDEGPSEVGDEDVPEPRFFVTGPSGLPVDVPPLPLSFVFSDVGETGKEPSIGITSSGCIFFIAMEKVMRSCDHGQSWEETQDPVQCCLLYTSPSPRDS